MRLSAAPVPLQPLDQQDQLPQVPVFQYVETVSEEAVKLVTMEGWSVEMAAHLHAHLKLGTHAAVGARQLETLVQVALRGFTVLVALLESLVPPTATPLQGRLPLHRAPSLSAVTGSSVQVVRDPPSAVMVSV